MRPLAAVLAMLAFAACGSGEYAPGDDLAGLPEPSAAPPAWATSATWHAVGLGRDVPVDSLAAARPDSLTAPASLQDVLDALPELGASGVTALVIAPMARTGDPSDAQSFHHVDPSLGPDPDGDRRMMALEDPSDPKTWSTTAADALLLAVVAAAHERKIRVVLDYTFGDTAASFWAHRDARHDAPDSPFAAWYQRPPVPADTAGGRADTVRFAFRQADPAHGAPPDGDLASGPKAYVLAATLRWLDPDGDGGPGDGVDGFWLAEAARVPLGFWRDLRRVTKAVNPQAVLVGEIPDPQIDPVPYLRRAFDLVMTSPPIRPRREIGSPPPRSSAVLLAHAGAHSVPRGPWTTGEIAPSRPFEAVGAHCGRRPGFPRWLRRRFAVTGMAGVEGGPEAEHLPLSATG